LSAVSLNEPSSLIERYRKIRQQSVDICAPLAIDDYQVQPMDDASPPKWHLAHITWFFETFILQRELMGYESHNPLFEILFNSYYQGVGLPYPRHRRGNLSRPTIEEVFEYRRAVDTKMCEFLSRSITEEVRFRVELGLHHEQQHQELLLTDLKYNLGNNPLRPAYLPLEKPLDKNKSLAISSLEWQEIKGGLVEIGARGDDFVFDNEKPRHRVFVPPFKLASRCVSNGEFLAFMEDGGYERHELWLSDGWAYLNGLSERWSSPLYWRREKDSWLEYTLNGERELEFDAPVCHISGYEADAYARWKGARLPLEAEWEIAAGMMAVEGNFIESGKYHPGIQSGTGMTGLFGDVWEWTGSSYGPYPGFKPFAGALGEYNGKFMANQLVLRGGSCATSVTHIRRTYRNFFYPPDRWQFSGLRLAQDIS
jgi:ergothioneine biosynthesis protein EgtB